MEDKMFELLTKMYSEFIEFRSETNTHFEKLEGRFGKLDGRVDKFDGHIIRLENQLKNDIKALYDGYKQNSESIEEIKAIVKVIAEKVDRHDIKIQVIEGGKRANG